MSSETFSASKTQQTYRAVREALLSCELRPGDRLKCNELAARYQVSPSAIREALSRLSSEGLVVATPQRGFRAAPISLGSLRDITEARMEIEALCLARSLRCGGLEWESRLIAAAHILRGTGRHVGGNYNWRDAHANFHEALVAACENESLLQIRRNLFEQTERYRRMSFVGPESEERVKKTDADHDLLLNAALARNVDEATALIRSHIGSTSQTVLHIIELAQDGDAEPVRAPVRSPKVERSPRRKAPAV
jgi:DNA-binding GntR family transcriptional regulator